MGGILYTVLHLSNTHKHMHTFMYLRTDNNNQSHVQQHEKRSKLKSIGTHSVTHCLPTSIVLILSVVFFNVSVNCLSPGTITDRERRLLFIYFQTVSKGLMWNMCERRAVCFSPWNTNTILLTRYPAFNKCFIKNLFFFNVATFAMKKRCWYFQF